MIMPNERELVIEYGKKLITAGLTKGTGGNVSMVNRELGYYAISPSGMDYFEIKPEDVVILDLKGKIVEGERKPSSEYEMHRVFYEKRSDISAVIHAHTDFATTIACMNWDLPAVHYLVALAGKDVKCAQYATYGTKELADNAFRAMENRFAVLLANHGILTGGKDMANAFKKLEEIEYCCQLYYRTKCLGNPVILSDKEMDLHLEKFKTYGDAAIPEK
jgi:L-fuculose-phosphate aldolase